MISNSDFNLSDAWFTSGSPSRRVEFDHSSQLYSMIEYHENGTVKTMGKFTETGEYHGLLKSTWPNGNLRFTGEYNYGLRVGMISEYFKDGTIMSECYYVNGLQHGLELVQIEGYMASLTMYSRGVIHGEIAVRYFRTEHDEGGGHTSRDDVHQYHINDEAIADMFDSPLTGAERFELQIIHGAPWIPEDKYGKFILRETTTC